MTTQDQEIADLRKALDEVNVEYRKLMIEFVSRKTRLEVMRSWMNHNWKNFMVSNPQAKDWFDEKGGSR